MTCLSQEAYLRNLIMSNEIKQSPPIEYYDLTRHLTKLCESINKIVSTRADSNRNSVIFQDSYESLLNNILRLQKAME